LNIDLYHTKDCPAGTQIVQVRLNPQDKKFIKNAAALVGMPMAAFLRTVAFQAAQHVHKWPETRGNEQTS
jgi:uncharacterized protein (DUF1778 family)